MYMLKCEMKMSAGKRNEEKQKANEKDRDYANARK